MTIPIVVPGVPFETFGNIIDRRNYSTDLFVSDARVGWWPAPLKTYTFPSGITMSSDQNRSRPTPRHPNANKVLILGDSFTYGAEVSDGEDWPSRLSEYSRLNVVNAAVPGYGFDQMLTRLKYELTRNTYDLIIVTIISDNVGPRLNQYVRNGASKPLYELDETGTLYLEDAQGEIVQDFDFAKRFFGFSHTVNRIMMQIAPEYWTAGSIFDTRIRDYPMLPLSKAIADEMVNLAQSHGPTPLAFILLPSAPNDLRFLGEPNLTHHLQKKSLDSNVFLFELLSSLHDTSYQGKPLYLQNQQGHYSIEGNMAVARLVAPIAKSIIEGSPPPSGTQYNEKIVVLPHIGRTLITAEKPGGEHSYQRLFDGMIGGDLYWETGEAYPNWLEIALPKPTWVEGYTIGCSNDYERMPSAWAISAAGPGWDLTHIEQRFNAEWSPGIHEYRFKEPLLLTKIIFSFQKGLNPNIMRIHELSLMVTPEKTSPQ